MSFFLDTSSMISNVLSFNIDTTTPITNIMAKNGKFQMWKTPLMTTIVKNDAILEDLPEIEESIVLNIPLIPFHVFELMASFFKKIYEKDKTESSIMLFYNEALDNFIIWAPLQENTTANSKYQRDDDPAFVEMCKNNMLVMVAHSHPWAATTAPGPSGTDNNDEKESLLYMIMSNVEKIPTYTLSTCPNAKRIYLNFSTIFEIPNLDITREEKIKMLLATKLPKSKIMNTFYQYASEEDFNEFFNDNIDTKLIVEKCFQHCVDEIPDSWTSRCSVKTYGNVYGGGAQSRYYANDNWYDKQGYNNTNKTVTQYNAIPPAAIPANTNTDETAEKEYQEYVNSKTGELYESLYGGGCD